MLEYNSDTFYNEVLSRAQEQLDAASAREQLSDLDKDFLLTDYIGNIHHEYWRQGREALERKSIVSLREAVQYMNAIEMHNERIKRKPDMDMMFATLVKWTEERDAVRGK